MVEGLDEMVWWGGRFGQFLGGVYGLHWCGPGRLN